MLLRTFGGLSIEATTGGDPVPSVSPRRLALLALVAAAGPRGITRDRILGILWPDADEEQARHTLSQTLYSLRRDTRAEWVTGTTVLRLDDAIACDVREFSDAVSANQLERAAAAYNGAFLDGFYLAGAPEFEQWVEQTRANLQFAALKALETLARRAVEAGAAADALHWWRRLSAIDPFNPAYAHGQVRALVTIGHQAGALRFAREYEARMKREFDVEPGTLVPELLQELRSRPAPAESALVFNSPADATRDAAPESAADSGPEPSNAPVAQVPDKPVPIGRQLWLPAAFVGVLMIGALAWSIAGSAGSRVRANPAFAIGTIQSRDTVVPGPVFRDMLATNLARIAGLDVVSNSRLVELLPRASEGNAAATADAARRAGATEIFEGELGVTTTGLVLTLRRVALEGGVVREGYTVRATDVYALADSATAAIARDLGFDPPADALATVRTRSAVAYALYEEGLRAIYGNNPEGALRLMSAALERDSTFAMAAYFAWLSARITNRFADAERLLPVTRALATRTVDRERLWIQGAIARDYAPVAEFMTIAREHATRFPTNPDAQFSLGSALFQAGDWAGAVAALNRAVAIDSAAGAITGPYCRVCPVIHWLVNTYMWSDSATSAERAARRLIAFRPNDASGWSGLVEPLLRQGRRSDAETAAARAAELSEVKPSFTGLLDRDLIRSGRSDELAARLASELGSAASEAAGERPWLLEIALRNQGRLREAERLAEKGAVPGSTARVPRWHDEGTLATIALERGQPHEAARRYLDLAAGDRASNLPLGYKSRITVWHMTLAATALAAAGDTATVRMLADSVQRVGSQSSFGRDYLLHHFLHGLLLQRQNRHVEAVEEFRRSLFSLTDGYTRVNLELARSLVALGRYAEAIAVLQPAVRGGVDGSNTYVTHTELHEALARAFDAAGQTDAAAAHYAFVERAWRQADPEFRSRYLEARARARSIR